MRLVAVSTGKTREIEIQGATVQTAYLKSPVAGPCFIDHRGPTGNQTAVHPDTVYAIATEHYAYWAKSLGADASQWGYGYFAENLTIDGLAEQELHVGDVLLIGTEVRLIVTGPRIPCFKVAWRMQRPQSFVRDFAASGRTGVYFAVLQPGSIEPGDAVRVVHRENTNPTVFEVGALARGEHRILPGPGACRVIHASRGAFASPSSARIVVRLPRHYTARFAKVRRWSCGHRPGHSGWTAPE